MSRDKYMREQLGPGAYIQQGRTNTPPSGTPQGGTVIVRRTIKRRSPSPPQLPASPNNAGHYTGDISQYVRSRQQDYTNPQAAIRFNRTYTQQTQAPGDNLDEEEFDDESATMMPRSGLRYQSLPTQHRHPRKEQGTPSLLEEPGNKQAFMMILIPGHQLHQKRKDGEYPAYTGMPG